MPFHLKGNMQRLPVSGPDTVEHPLGQLVLQLPHWPSMWRPLWSVPVLHQGTPWLSAVVHWEYSTPRQQTSQSEMFIQLVFGS